MKQYDTIRTPPGGILRLNAAPPRPAPGTSLTYDRGNYRITVKNNSGTLAYYAIDTTLGADQSQVYLTYDPNEFVPSNLSSLRLWLEGDSGYYNDAGTTLATDGQTVQQWNDQSGQANHLTQSTSGDRMSWRANILNGKGILRCDASSDHMDIPLGINFPECTIMMIVKPVTISGYRTPLTHNGRFPFCTTLGGGNWGIYLNADVTSGTTLTTATWYLLSVTVRAVADVDLATNGGAIVTRTNGNAVTGSGSELNRQGVGQEDTFDIAAVIICNAAIGEFYRRMMRDYLNRRWAVY